MLLERRWRRLILAGLGTAVVTAGAACKDSRETKQPDPIETAFEAFEDRIDSFMAIRKRVVDSIGDLDPTRSQAEIATRATALGRSLIAARPDAKPGDIFTPEIAAVIATLIKEEHRRRADTVLETREDQQEELPDFVPEVNRLYPTTYPLATFPPALLPLLPALPEPLEYRVAQRYLMLRDIEANLIIDFMPNAMP